MTRRRPPRIRCRGDQGVVGGIEAIPFGLLVLVAGALIVTNAWAVIDAKGAAEAAAREAVRRYVEAPDPAEAAEAADEAARSTLTGLGRDAERAVVGASDPEEAFRRCQPVTVTVTLRVHRIAVPFIGGTAGEMDVTGRHTEIVDPYRSGEFDGGCP